MPDISRFLRIALTNENPTGLSFNLFILKYERSNVAKPHPTRKNSKPRPTAMQTLRKTRQLQNQNNFQLNSERSRRSFTTKSLRGRASQFYRPNAKKNFIENCRLETKPQNQRTLSAKSLVTSAQEIIGAPIRADIGMITHKWIEQAMLRGDAIKT